MGTGKTVNFAGQTIEVGLCWGSRVSCGALSSLASGFNVWRYFKNKDGFSEVSSVVRFKDSSNNVLFAIAYLSLNDTTVRLFYQYATFDGMGVPQYLSSDINYDTMQDLGYWSGEPSPYYHVFSKSNLYNDDDYRASVYFYYFDKQLGDMEYDNVNPSYADGSMTIFNGYKLGGSQIEQPLDIEMNLGMVYPDNSATVIPDIDKPVYRYNGQSTQHSFLPDLLNNTEVEVIDSYEQDTATTGGGYGGGYGYGGDSIDFWGVPGLSVLDTGFIRMYSPTSAQLRALGAFLWSDDFFDNFIKLIQDPIEAIIQVGIVPLDLSSFLDTSEHIYLGNVDSEVSAQPLTQQVIPLDMGSVYIRENWHNALDYEPMSVCDCYLPFIGNVPLKMNEVMDSKLTLRYYIDLLSGDCVAVLKIDKVSKNGIGLHSVMYHYRGNMLMNIPITGKNYSSFFSGLITSTVGAMAGSVAGGIGGAIAGGISGATSLMNTLPSMQKSGSFTGASGWIGCYTPYITINRPIQQLPYDYSKYVGYPLYKDYYLRELSGFTKVEKVIDNTVVATDTEKKMIEEALMKGVIL